MGGSHRLAVTTVLQTSTVTETHSFDALSFNTSSFADNTTAQSSFYVRNAARTGGVAMNVGAYGMGPGGASAGARVGGTACEATFWTTETALLCQVNPEPNPKTPNPYARLTTYHQSLHFPPPQP